ncbi:MAG TPA: hypothetical protein V6D18_00285, partial [Thermosynechococcaceae cyanobacterium]
MQPKQNLLGLLLLGLTACAQPAPVSTISPVSPSPTLPPSSPARIATTPSPVPPLVAQPVPTAQIRTVLAPTASPSPTLSPKPGDPLRKATSGEGCQCPYDLNKRGHPCGKRSAYSRPGGESPQCYVQDQ